MKKAIAYCGLDCEKCDARIATINNDDALREKTASLWSELNGIKITKEMINCMGCRTDGVKTQFCSSLCEIRKCAINKHIETCFYCEKKTGCNLLSKIINNNKEAKSNMEI